MRWTAYSIHLSVLQSKTNTLRKTRNVRTMGNISALKLSFGFGLVSKEKNLSCDFSRVCVVEVM